MADLNETFARLSDSINQQAATALINLTVPEFSGKPGNDIGDFIRKFKSATITLSDEWRCHALNKALTGPAYTWAKCNIKTEIKTGDWRGAKRKLIDRFTSEDRTLKYHEKLQKFKYDPKENTLSSYVEIYADLFRKTHDNHADSDIIRALRLNLPSEILGHLNTISDTWTELKSLRDFMTLIQRIERKILPYVKQPKADDNNLAVLAQTIKNLEATIMSHKLQEKPVNDKPTEVIAMVNHQRTNRYQGNNPGRTYQNDRNYRKNNDSRPGKRDNSFGPQDDSDRKRRPVEESPEELQRKYEEEHGKPPGPCWKCRGAHFNRHCPYMIKN